MHAGRHAVIHLHLRRAVSQHLSLIFEARGFVLDFGLRMLLQLPLTLGALIASSDHAGAQYVIAPRLQLNCNLMPCSLAK